MQITPDSRQLTADRWHVRRMVSRDLAEVLRIERDGFPNPWPEADFVRTLRERDMRGIVAEDLASTDLVPPVAGFAVWHVGPKILNVFNLAVGLEHRRQGCGSAILADLVSRLNRTRRRLLLFTDERNLRAHLFFRACGLRADGVEREFYEEQSSGRRIDAYRFVYRLPRDADCLGK